MGSDSGQLNRASLSFYIDTNIIDATDDASVFLRRLNDEAWVYLQRTDVMDTELASAPADKWASLTGASSTYPEALGPGVWGHSRWDHAVWGNEDDGERIERVRQILHGSATGARKGTNHLRDAMHIATAIRYGSDGFVTHDSRALKKAQAISEVFSGFNLLSPLAAVGLARARIKSVRELHRLEPQRGMLPEWPGDSDWP